jgi:hypothetical protein
MKRYDLMQDINTRGTFWSPRPAFPTCSKPRIPMC